MRQYVVANVNDGTYVHKSKKGKFSLVPLCQASLFNRMDEAEKLVKQGLNSLPRRVQLKVLVIDIHEPDIEPQEKQKQPISNDACSQTIADARLSLQSQLSNLQAELSVADRRLSDIYHYIELSENLNACAGYNAYKLCRDALRERRVIKDAVMLSETTLTKLQAVERDIADASSKMKERVYMPREITELFENSGFAQTAT